MQSPENILFGPDGNVYVATSNFPKHIVRFDPRTGKNPGVFASEDEQDWATGSHHSWAFGPDGNLYVAGWSEQGSVFRYDGETGEYVDKLVPSHGRITALAFAPKGDL